MQRIATGTRPVPGRSSAVYVTITIDPGPEFTPQTFEQERRRTPALNEALVDVDTTGENVVVVLYDFSLTKWTLMQTGRFPAFAELLPDED